jgi:curved DNA-binding protein CbpA
VWTTLGLDPKATVAEIQRAYKRRALETHPDRGGSAESFRALHKAYESALQRRAKHPQKSKPRQA